LAFALTTFDLRWVDMLFLLIFTKTYLAQSYKMFLSCAKNIFKIFSFFFERDATEAIRLPRSMPICTPQKYTKYVSALTSFKGLLNVSQQLGFYAIRLFLKQLYPFCQFVKIRSSVLI